MHGSYRGLRGGAFDINVNILRASLRSDDYDPTDESYSIGFRVVEVPEPATIVMLALVWLGIVRRR